MTETAENISSSSSRANEKFSLSAVALEFRKCQQSDLSIDAYISGYEQLVLFLQSLSKAFYFVVQDVQDKMRILREHRNGPNSANYATVALMLQTESAEQFKSNGSRTLLRLHRALQFISKLLSNLVAADASQSTAKIAGDAYAETLSPHHAWTVRKAVGLALYLLPTREALLQQMSQENQCDESQCKQLVADAVTELDIVYGNTHTLYEQYKALALP